MKGRHSIRVDDIRRPELTHTKADRHINTSSSSSSRSEARADEPSDYVVKVVLLIPDLFTDEKMGEGKEAKSATVDDKKYILSRNFRGDKRTLTEHAPSLLTYLKPNGELPLKLADEREAWAFSIILEYLHEGRFSESIRTQNVSLICSLSYTYKIEKAAIAAARELSDRWATGDKEKMREVMGAFLDIPDAIAKMCLPDLDAPVRDCVVRAYADLEQTWQQPSFLAMGERPLLYILESDHLTLLSENVVFRALVGWCYARLKETTNITALTPGDIRWRQAVGKYKHLFLQIRYSRCTPNFLFDVVQALLPPSSIRECASEVVVKIDMAIRFHAMPADRKQILGFPERPRKYLPVSVLQGCSVCWTIPDVRRMPPGHTVWAPRIYRNGWSFQARFTCVSSSVYLVYEVRIHRSPIERGAVGYCTGVLDVSMTPSIHHRPSEPRWEQRYFKGDQEEVFRVLQGDSALWPVHEDGSIACWICVADTDIQMQVSGHASSSSSSSSSSAPTHLLLTAESR